MDKNNLFLMVGGFFLLLGLILPTLQLRRKILLNAQKPMLKKVIDAVLLPVNFGALFLNNRKVEQLPAYYRYFLKFTEFTSCIPYFHFLPKAMIAFASEGVIAFFTGEDVLMAVVSLWSICFLTIVTVVESQAGEMEEKIVTFANKLFLYTVSVLTIIILTIYAFFWETVEPMLDNKFFHFIAEMTHLSNYYLYLAWIAFWKTSWVLKFIIIFILVAYMSSSFYLSKKIKK